MRIFSHTGLWTLCVCLLVHLSSASTTVGSFAHAQSVKAPAKTKKVVKRKGRSKSVRHCMKFTQRLGADEESVDLKLKSQCKFEVVCSLEWELTCTDDSGAKTSLPGKQSTSLEFTDDWSINASAATCETDWEVGDVRWNCVPADL